MKVQTRAKLRYLRMSPRKVRLLVDLIRGLHVQDALAQLDMSAKHASRPVKKLLESAIANATHNDNADASTLVVKTATVDGGPILYRWMPRAFGRASKIKKRTSHITLILEGEQKETSAKPLETKNDASSKKEEAKKTTTEKATKKTSAKKTTPKKKAEDKKESK